ncbi:MAG: 2-oxo acid dehydrogenase subunit E2 [Candidatus Thermoplasmatota archaeon]|nr:2-oxo acid dehydrogenase subunit E2 [Candidatus Thermoplasmatota archaeon]MBS3801578.1 2-oxo acid dehydrogenase subunit E2 [Candidatus Thermoplasmatota archaeon]
MAKKMKINAWRKTAINIYSPPRDGKVYGTYEIDASPLLNFISEKKKKGVRITVTNMVTAALARTLYFDVPEMNCFVRRGKLMQRDDAHVFLAVAQSGKSVQSMIIPKAQEKTVTEIAQYQKERLERIYSGKKKSFNIQKSIAKVPWPFRGAVVKFIKWWLFDNGFPLPFVKLKPDPFGSIAISNIGVFGLSSGYLALLPISNLPAIIAMGKIKEKPVVVDGEIVIRPMLPISGTFDHRIVEGDKIGLLKDGAEKRLLHPESLDKPEKK